MPELQIALLAVGGVVIALLLGFNWWQDRRVRRRMQATLPLVEKDPLFNEVDDGLAIRRDPVWGGEDEDSLQVSRLGGIDEEPLAQDTEEPDPAIEVVIEITFQSAISAQDLVEIAQPLRSAGRKPVRVFAQDTEGHLSRKINPASAYISMQVAVLLANRSGVLTAIEWSQIWNRLQSLADQMEATIEGPEQQAVLEAALRLDSACAALDRQVGLTLRTRSTRAVADVVSTAKSMGFIAEKGALAWYGDHGLVCFTLFRFDAESFDAGMAGVDTLTLLLDVPRTPADTRAFGRMVEIGLELSRRLGAELVDDMGREVVQGSDASIDEQLQVLFAQLASAGFPAGSQRALRVFA